MTHDDHTLAAAYALDALDTEEREAFEMHLATCDACATDVREMRATTTRFALAETATPPEQMRERVLTLAEQTPQLRNDSPVALPRRSVGVMNRWLVGVAAAAIIVAGALGVSTIQANHRASQLQTTAQQLSAILTDPASERKTADVTGGGTGMLIVSRSNQQAVLATAGIPSVTSDQTYQLWAINGDGAVSIGLYNVDPAGDGTELVDFPDSATTFGMTVEPASGSSQPTTEPVLVIPVGA